MKLLDLFSGFIVTTGSMLLHIANGTACGFFYFGELGKGIVD
jgi:hypothetical protein